MNISLPSIPTYRNYEYNNHFPLFFPAGIMNIPFFIFPRQVSFPLFFPAGIMNILSFPLFFPAGIMNIPFFYPPPANFPFPYSFLQELQIYHFHLPPPSFFSSSLSCRNYEYIRFPYFPCRVGPQETMTPMTLC